MNHSDIAISMTPILNHLLVVPPFDAAGGLDFGWYCREHALAAKLVYDQFGIECDIVRGHVTAYVAGKKRLTTVGTGADHVWCATEALVPCDLSMTLRHFAGYPTFNPPVLGCENNGDFIIVYAKHASEFPDALQSDVNAVYFGPTETLPYTCHQYISNPELLLPTNESGNIVLAIAAYITEVAITSNHLFHGDTSQESALQLLLSRYPNPSLTLEKRRPTSG